MVIKKIRLNLNFYLYNNKYMIDLIITISIGVCGLYYLYKVYSGNCNPQPQLAIEAPPPIDPIPEREDEEVPPKYEDIVAVNN